MLNSYKIAISIPREDFLKIETLRKKFRLKRSAIVDRALRFWFRKLEEQEMIQKYEEGYRKKPEPIDEIKAMEKASSEAFKEESWK